MPDGVFAPSLSGRGVPLEQVSHQQISKQHSSEKECLLEE